MKNLILILALLMGVSAHAQPGTYPISCKQVRIKIDVSFAYYDYFKDSAAASNNILNMFKGVQWLLQREGIAAKLYIGKVWETVDPYAAISGRDPGEQVRLAYSKDSYLKPDTGMYDVAIWYDRQTGTNNRENRGAVGGLNLFGQNYVYVCVPTAWDVQTGKYHPVVKTVAHELGHVMGSKHSHWCGWKHKDGRIAPIDCVWTVEPIVSGGTRCTNIRTKNPTGVMGYGDLVLGAGVSFDIGYGELPGQVMRDILAKSAVPCVGMPPPPLPPCQFDSVCINGNWVYTAKNQPCQGTKPPRSCAQPIEDGVIGPVMHYTQNSTSFFRFNIPSTGNWLYEVSYCRYDGPMNPPDSITPAAACGIRNALNFSRPSAIQLSNGQINLQAITQPAERNKYYRVRVRYRNGSSGSIQTKQSAWFWW